MPAELSIVESTTELGQTVVEVVLESASEPGPAGPGVPTGGTDGQVLTKTSATDFATAWEDPTGGGGGAPDDVDYLVGTASGDLSAEIVVGTSPGGELGGTWASPTVDATHSGSTHAAVQAAAEATAAAALATHEADTTNVHGLADTANVMETGDAAGGVLGGTYPNPSFAADMATQAELDAHISDTSAAHAASAVGFTPAGNLAADDVQEALEELDAEKAAASHAHAGEDITSGTVADARIASTIARDSEVTSAISTHEADTTSVHGIADTSALALTANHPTNATFNDHSARHENGGADEISIAGLDGTPTELTNHLNDASDAHDASAISVLDSGANYTATDVEGVLAEIAPQLGGGSGLFDAYALLRDEKAANTQGGTFTTGAWQTRDLNTESVDTGGIVSLSSNQFTLQAGTYWIWARAPALRVGFHKLKIANITDTTDALIGSNAFTITGADGHMTDSIVQGRITIAAQKTFELQHRCSSTKATDGLGSLVNLGVVEVYAEVQIWREA